MNEELPSLVEHSPVRWFEETMQVRGCLLSLERIKEAYRDIQEINLEFGRTVVASLIRPDGTSEDEWQKYKDFLIKDAFRLTVTVKGFRDEILYGESEAIFVDPAFPKPTKSIFFTNINSFSRNSNGREPKNRVSVLLDFSKPEIFDPNPLVSSATPNDSHVVINAQDIAFFNSAQKVVEKKLISKKSWYGAIHRNFAYDIGLWLIALPASLYSSAVIMDQYLPVGGSLELFRWPFYVYLLGILLIVYRSLTAYAKWAFPVNILIENNDNALRHRLTLAAIMTWLAYQIGSTVFARFFG